MRRSRSYPITPAAAVTLAGNSLEGTSRDEEEEDEGDEEFLFHPPAYGSASPVEDHEHHHETSTATIATTTTTATAALVRNIASFLTLSDAASLSSFAAAPTPADSWAVGVELDADPNSNSSNWSLSNIATPLTPALVALSPGTTPQLSAPAYGGGGGGGEDEDDGNGDGDGEDDSAAAPGTAALRGGDCENSSWDGSERMEGLLRDRRRRWAQEKITAAVFSHPRSLRSFCWEAYIAAKDIRAQKELAAIYIEDEQESPETQVEPASSVVTTNRKRKRSGKTTDLRSKIVHEVVDWIFHSVPVSVLLDVLDALGVTGLDTAGASFAISIASLQHAVAALGRVVCTVWETITHCVTNPFQVLEAVISLQFNAMGKTSEVLVSGIQSVATGVGSASSLALYRLSATANKSSSASLAGRVERKSSGTIPGEGKSGVLNKRLLHKLSTINDAARMVDYQEREDDLGGLTRHAVSRTRRMMHYSVSLRPFVATVTVAYSPKEHTPGAANEGLFDEDQDADLRVVSVDVASKDSSSYSSPDEDPSPFMCTPQSFPPTPHSRQMVIAQRSQLSDDVVFLARDRLRVHDGLGSDNVRTRERSQALEVGKRLAIFACDKDSGIELTCGRHIATKGGNMYYASARSMVAVLRNCFVYFELTVLPRLISPAVATLSIGMSTEEMPPNTLVGAWQSSVGLCTTGQILMAGQWCSPADPAKFAYGMGSTVGCLVCLDDESAFETWDGVMVQATIRFNVNGVMVSPPVSTLPMSGAPSSLPTSSSAMPLGSPTSLAGSVGSLGVERLPPGRGSPTGQPPPATLSLLVPSAEDLYPTVTLQSPATSVVCRFSSEDVMASTREVIGAPAGVAVYAVDGSVILSEHEESSSSSTTF